MDFNALCTEAGSAQIGSAVSSIIARAHGINLSNGVHTTLGRVLLIYWSFAQRREAANTVVPWGDNKYKQDDLLFSTLIDRLDMYRFIMKSLSQLGHLAM